jgi:hypothetical protein
MKILDPYSGVLRTQNLISCRSVVLCVFIYFYKYSTFSAPRVRLELLKCLLIAADFLNGFFLANLYISVTCFKDLPYENVRSFCCIILPVSGYYFHV